MQKRFTPDEGGVFPEWEEKTIEEACNVNVSNGTPGDKFIYIELGDVNKYGLLKRKNLVRKNEAPVSAKRVAKIDDVFFRSVRPGNKGHFHYTNEMSEQVVMSSAFFQLSMKDGDNEFLYQTLNTQYFTKQVLTRCTGTTYPTISLNEFIKLKIKIPKSIEEQRKIAAALVAYDEMIAVKTAKFETWQECKKRMVKEIFGRTKRFKDDDGNEFPEWEEKTLGEITEYVRNGYSYKTDGVRTHKYKVTRIETISTGKINPEKLGSCEECDEKYLLKPGDILYSNINSLSYLGNTAIYKNSSEKIYHGMNLLCIRPKSGDIDADYLFAFLNSEAARKFVKYNAQRAVNQCSIKVSDVRNMRIPLPCMEEQQKIGSFLAEIDKEIKIEKEFVKTYAEGKKKIMRELMEG